ncbi:MAG: hypothetical protein QW303_00470 [Nitrososphaerota archaeon]
MSDVIRTNEILHEEIRNFVLAVFGVIPFYKTYENEFLKIQFKLLTTEERNKIENYLNFQLSSEENIREDEEEQEKILARLSYSLYRIDVNEGKFVNVFCKNPNNDLHEELKRLIDSKKITDAAFSLILAWYSQFESYCNELTKICKGRNFFNENREAFWLTVSICRVNSAINISNSVSINTLFSLVSQIEKFDREIKLHECNLLTVKSDKIKKGILSEIAAKLFGERLIPGINLAESTFSRLKELYIKTVNAMKNKK